MYIDGESAEIAKIDGCFMGIPLKKGNHDVVMKFRPMDLYVGAVMTLSFYVLFILFVIRRKRIEARK